MSRLYEFMKMSTDDEDIAKIRSVSFKLVKEETGHGQLLGSIDEVFAKEILVLQKELNAELKKRYNGNYRYDLCIDEGHAINVLKIKRKQAKSLSMLWHESNDKLSKIKKNIEINLTFKQDK